MAWTRVRDTGKARGSAVATLAASFAALPAIGNLIVVEIAINSGSAFAAGEVTDNQGHTYTLDIASNVTIGLSRVAIYSTVVTASSGIFTITYDPADTSFYVVMTAVEWSGQAATPLDKTAAAEGTFSTAPAVSSGVLAQADELIVAVSANDATNNPTTYTKDSAFTEDVQELDATTYVGCEGSYKVVNSTSSVTSTWTTDFQRWVAVMATYKMAAETAPFPGFQRRRRRAPNLQFDLAATPEAALTI